MAKTKADLQADCEAYRDIAGKVRKAHQQQQFQDALELAVAALAFVDGMMQFERRFENSSGRESVECIDYILRYSPLLFDTSSLEKVSTMLKSQKRIEKNTTDNLNENLDSANSLMWQAHRLWNYLEHCPEVRQDRLRSELGGDQERWRWMAETWERMGLVRRTPDGGSYRLALHTRLDSEARGKCPSCGVTGKASKERLLQPIKCPKCHVDVVFVLIPEPARTN